MDNVPLSQPTADAAQPLPRRAPQTVLAQSSEADADDPADGSRRMRRCGAGHGTCLSWRLGPAGATPRRLRGLARRQQGEQYRQGGAPFRSRRPRASARSPRRCTNCRCPASSTGTSIISWCWRASTATASISMIRRSDAGGSTWRNSILPSPASCSPWSQPRRSGKSASKPQGLRLLLRELRGSKAAVGLLVMVSFALVVPSIVAAGFSKIFVDDILIRHTATGSSRC